MKVRALAAAAAGTMFISVLAYSPAAEAFTEWDYCADGGDNLTTGTVYSVATQYRMDVTKHSMTIGGNTQDQNNLEARLRHTVNTPVYWAWTRDNINGGQTYAPTPNVEVPRQETEMNTVAVFDQFGGDPSCHTQIQMEFVDQ